LPDYFFEKKKIGLQQDSKLDIKPLNDDSGDDIKPKFLPKKASHFGKPPLAKKRVNSKKF